MICVSRHSERPVPTLPYLDFCASGDRLFIPTSMQKRKPPCPVAEHPHQFDLICTLLLPSTTSLSGCQHRVTLVHSLQQNHHRGQPHTKILDCGCFFSSTNHQRLELVTSSPLLRPEPAHSARRHPHLYLDEFGPSLTAREASVFFSLRPFERWLFFSFLQNSCWRQ